MAGLLSSQFLLHSWPNMQSPNCLMQHSYKGRPCKFLVKNNIQILYHFNIINSQFVLEPEGLAIFPIPEKGTKTVLPGLELRPMSGASCMIARCWLMPSPGRQHNPGQCSITYNLYRWPTTSSVHNRVNKTLKLIFMIKHNIKLTLRFTLDKFSPRVFWTKESGGSIQVFPPPVFPNSYNALAQWTACNSSLCNNQLNYHQQCTNKTC